LAPVDCHRWGAAIEHESMYLVNEEQIVQMIGEALHNLR
jgi:hypothetical protein